MSNNAWRTRSEVGRVVAPGGATKARPRHVPATILTGRDEGTVQPAKAGTY
jgi:hypothetical protein